MSRWKKLPAGKPFQVYSVLDVAKWRVASFYGDEEFENWLLSEGLQIKRWYNDGSASYNASIPNIGDFGPEGIQWAFHKIERWTE